MGKRSAFCRIAVFLTKTRGNRRIFHTLFQSARTRRVYRVPVTLSAPNAVIFHRTQFPGGILLVVLVVGVVPPRPIGICFKLFSRGLPIIYYIYIYIYPRVYKFIYISDGHANIRFPTFRNLGICEIFQSGFGKSAV